eukprot:COSAG02_NODE_62778_length_265_cov_0.584337_1_plen_34_part_10
MGNKACNLLLIPIKSGHTAPHPAQGYLFRGLTHS